jgi:glycogen synthase
MAGRGAVPASGCSSSNGMSGPTSCTSTATPTVPSLGAPVLVVGHSCVLSWWRAVHGCAAPPAWDRTARRAAGLRAARSWRPDALHAGRAAAHYGPLPPATVVPNGCDADALPLGSRDAFGRYARQRAAAGPFVLAAGRIWDEAKNMDDARRRPRPHPLAGVRRGRRHRAGRHRAACTACTASVCCRSMTLRWYQRASVFAHPACLRAVRSGAAGGRAAAAPWCWRTSIVAARGVGDAAVFVPPRDPHALAAR